MTLYFVKATRGGWDTVFGGHWLADSPKHAIALAQADIDANPHMSRDDGMVFSAKRSKANPDAMALNAPHSGVRT